MKRLINVLAVFFLICTASYGQIEIIKRGEPSVDISQWINAVSTVDVNSTLVLADVFETVSIPSVNIVQINPTTVRFEKDGLVRVYGTIPMIDISGNNQRFNAQFQWALNSAVIPNSPLWRSNYMRDTGGHNETSQEFPPYSFMVNAGDILQLRVSRISGAEAVVQMRSTVIEIEYIN